MVYAHVPATADSEVVSFGNKMDEAFVIFEFIDGLGGAVCGMVVNDDEVVLEIGFLVQYGSDGVADGADAVSYRDDDGGFILKIACREFYLLEFRFQVSADFFQMLGAGFSISIWRSRFLGST